MARRGRLRRLGERSRVRLALGAVVAVVVFGFFTWTFASSSPFFTTRGQASAQSEAKQLRNKIIADKVHERQLMNKGDGEVEMGDLIYAIVPNIHCPNAVRIGDIADGGKWLCDMFPLTARPCIAYSLGVGGNPSFERDLVAYSACDVFSFDPNASYARLFANKSRVTFRAWEIAASDNRARREYTLATIMRMLGHSSIDVLKVDIEFAEYQVIPSFLMDPYFASKSPSATGRRPALPCQILIEVHGANARYWSALLAATERRGYYIYSRETNSHCYNTLCVEYGLLHKHCFDSFGIKEPIVFQNFGS